jgi:hypothetical protein
MLNRLLTNLSSICIVVFFCLFPLGCGPLSNFHVVAYPLQLLHTLCCCIVEGEQIITPLGTIPVEEISVDDKVISVSASGEQVISLVVAKQTASSDSYIELILDGQEESLRVTSAHPIATLSCWKRAGDLAVGEWVRTQNELKRVRTVSYRAGPVKVYNITVSPYSNFLAEGILVHNKTIAPSTDQELPDTSPKLEDGQKK